MDTENPSEGQDSVSRFFLRNAQLMICFGAVWLLANVAAIGIGNRSTLVKAVLMILTQFSVLVVFLYPPIYSNVVYMRTKDKDAMTQIAFRGLLHISPVIALYLVISLVSWPPEVSYAARGAILGGISIVYGLCLLRAPHE